MARQCKLIKTGYKFLEDPKSVEFIQKSKVMMFLSGFGHGRTAASSLSEELSKKYTNSSKVLQFSNSSISKDVDEAIENNIRTIVIDNANDNVDVMQKYYTTAQNHRYIEMAITSDDDGSYKPVAPTFFGWFLNEKESENIRNFGKRLLDECFKFEDFSKEFWEHCEDPGTENIDKYLTTKELDVGGEMLHCTAMYHSQENFLEYSHLVAPHIGEAFQGIKVIGFLITPRTFGARLKIDDYALKLWDITDSGDTVGWKPSKFSPTNGRGSRAHLSLLTGPGVHAVQTGIDLSELIKLEVKAKQEEFPEYKIEINNQPVSVLRYGKGQAIVYLNDHMPFSCFMSGCNLNLK